MRPALSLEEVLFFIQRSKFIAQKNGFPQLAEDFSQEVILQMIENPEKKSILDHRFIDFLRKLYGKGTGKINSHLNWVCLDDQPLAAPSDTCIDFSFFFQAGKQRSFYRLYFKEGYTLDEIAESYKITRGRACQILKEIKTKIMNYYKNYDPR